MGKVGIYLRVSGGEQGGQYGGFHERFADGLPIGQKIPYIGDYFVRDVPPSDNVSLLPRDRFERRF